MEISDFVICYQSRVGPVEWLRPYTDDEIRRCGQDGKHLIIVPVAFVSEHSETLVELDLEYRELATECAVPSFNRIKTVQDNPVFIEGLSTIVHGCSQRFAQIRSDSPSPPCGNIWRACPVTQNSEG